MTTFYLNSVESTVFHKVKAFVSKYSWIKPNMLNGSMKAVMFKELWLIVDDEEVVYIKDASDMPVLKTVHEHVSSINIVLMFFMLKKVPTHWGKKTDQSSIIVIGALEL